MGLNKYITVVSSRKGRNEPVQADVKEKGGKVKFREQEVV